MFFVLSCAARSHAISELRIGVFHRQYETEHDLGASAAPKLSAQNHELLVHSPVNPTNDRPGKVHCCVIAVMLFVDTDILHNWLGTMKFPFSALVALAVDAVRSRAQRTSLPPQPRQRSRTGLFLNEQCGGRFFKKTQPFLIGDGVLVARQTELLNSLYSNGTCISMLCFAFFKLVGDRWRRSRNFSR